MAGKPKWWLEETNGGRERKPEPVRQRVTADLRSVLLTPATAARLAESSSTSEKLARALFGNRSAFDESLRNAKILSASMSGLPDTRSQSEALKRAYLRGIAGEVNRCDG